MNTRVIIALALLLMTSCAKRASDDWANIDYARIARENYQRENDSTYTPPQVSGCVDDDLYNCSPAKPYYR